MGNVEVIRTLYAEVRFDRADAGSFERAVNAFFRLLDSEAEWQPDENDMDPELLRGHTEIRDFFERHAEPWQQFRWEPSDLRKTDDEVVAIGQIYAAGREGWSGGPRTLRAPLQLPRGKNYPRPGTPDAARKRPRCSS